MSSRMSRRRKNPNDAASMSTPAASQSAPTPTAAPAPTTNRQTRGKKVNIPEELRKYSRQERKDMRSEKEEQAAAEKTEADNNRKKKAATARDRIAEEMDKEALHDDELISTRPDLLEPNSPLPEPEEYPLRTSSSPDPYAPPSHAQSSFTADGATDGSEPPFSEPVSESEGGMHAESVHSTEEMDVDVFDEEHENHGTGNVASMRASDSEESLDNEERVEYARLKAKLDAKKEKKKEAKVAVRTAVTAARTNPPKTPVLQMTTSSTKPIHILSDDDDDLLLTKPANKRAKVTEIGGLALGTKKYLALAKATWNTSRIPSETEVEPLVVGEFDADESPEILRASRDNKASKKQQKLQKGSREVELVDADVKEIEVEERENAGRRRVILKKEDLPIVSKTDYNIWSSELVPDLIEWCGTRANQFGLGNEAELPNLLASLWEIHFGNLKHIPKTYADALYAQSQIRTYRSKLGVAALQAVSERITELELEGKEAIKKWVEEQLDNDAFSCEVPGPTRLTSQGALRSKLVTNTFAYHLTWVLAAKTPVGNPAGALALSAAAVARALYVWKDGEDSVEKRREERRRKIEEEKKKGAKKDKGKSKEERKPIEDPLLDFGENWEATLDKFFTVAQQFDDTKFERVYQASEAYITHLPASGAGPAYKESTKPSVNQSRAATVEEDRFVVSD
ncbi:hypothetical protein D9758_014608 [Tetrapyrgos nigripes]|uniref:Uncharacterized protein n=1 Tax=Tetrapyrgos nigripes TaxID=182062 RepID=A0A8H5CXJ5_9AGAR|nr:hypothetical protein D9758_014608 [Tetrapyrgos nigripes]